MRVKRGGFRDARLEIRVVRSEGSSPFVVSGKGPKASKSPLLRVQVCG